MVDRVVKTDQTIKNYYQMKLRLLREDNNRLRIAIVALETGQENEVKKTC
jgi:hypothetical protein